MEAVSRIALVPGRHAFCCHCWYMLTGLLLSFSFCFSEGLNDDYNKALWSALTLEPGPYQRNHGSAACCLPQPQSLSCLCQLASLICCCDRAATGLSVQNLTRQYARTFFGAENEEQATRGLLGLEQNWIGEAANNGAVATTLEAWRVVKLDAPSWRRDMYEFRATVDAYVQARETYELAGEAEARQALANASSSASAARFM